MPGNPNPCALNMGCAAMCMRSFSETLKCNHPRFPTSLYKRVVHGETLTI